LPPGWAWTRSCSAQRRTEETVPSPVAKGTLCAFGLTEANAGSDAGGILTTARLDGSHYVLNGTKQWITNGGEADIYTVIAMTNKAKGPRGASAFIVEKGTPGFTFGKKENKMGIRGPQRGTDFPGLPHPERELIMKEGYDLSWP